MPDTVVVASLASLAGLAGVVLGQVLARSGEYSKWLRSERHKSAAELLACGEAFRRHSAALILARYRASRAPEDDLGDALDPEIHLADLERLGLALEAVRTVFPRHVAALADEFGEATRRLAHVALAKPGEVSAGAGEEYAAARQSLTDEVRPLIAPTTREWFKLRHRVRK